MKFLWTFLLAFPVGIMLIALPAKTIAQVRVQFEKYPVTQIYKGKPAPLNLNSNPNAAKFRDRLQDGVQKGANFAGHYTIVTWGCGTSCQTSAIVDTKTGAVYTPGIVSEVGIKYKLNSRLLIINPSENITEVYGKKPPNGIKSKYYRWENNRLIQFKPPVIDRTAYAMVNVNNELS